MQVKGREEKALKLHKAHFSENCIEVAGRLRWEIQICSGYLQDLARLDGRSAQFFHGDNAGSKGRHIVKIE